MATGSTRVLCPVLVILTLAGCGRPHISPSPGVELPDRDIDSIVLENGDVLDFDWFGHGQWGTDTSTNAHVVGDNVVGYVDGQRTEVSLADIHEIQYRRPAYIGPLVFTLILLVPAVLLAWAGSGWSLD